MLLSLSVLKKMKSLNNISIVTLLVIGTILSVYRISNVSEKEISWDVLGYYLPLPATFIHDDPTLNNIDWLQTTIEEKDLAGTLYMVSSNEKGEPMYFFLLGMALFYLPFFLIGHLFAWLMGFPLDGFSLPYQYALVIGGIVYTLIGLVYLRKIVAHFFSDKITSLVLLIIVFSTNYIHHLTLKNLETVNMLFMLVCVILWFTIKWHKNQKLKYLLIIGSSITLITLVKPSEILIILIPFLWNVYSKQSFKEKIALLISNKIQLLITIAVCVLIASPQMIYWIIKTGSPLYDSYKNPGVGLDLFSPHISESLFSYRKGWLVYTPVMAFSLLGLPLVFKKNKKIFFALITYFLVAFYVISSWSEWWYGAAFSNRPLIVTYPLLAISLGYFLVYLKNKRTVIIIFTTLTLSFTFLNQFQWWQLKNYILDPYRTTKEYYWATFLKTSIAEEDRKLLLVKRNFDGKMSFDDPENYQSSVIQSLHFNSHKDSQTPEETKNNFYQLAEDEEYALTNKINYNTLTNNDHLWVVISFDARYPSDFKDTWPCMVITMDRKEGNYGYYAPEIKPDSLNNEWASYHFEYLTSEIRNRNDFLKFFIWKRGKTSFDVANFKVEIFEKNTYINKE